MIKITVYNTGSKKDDFTMKAEAEYIKRLSRTARISFQRLAKAPPDAIWFHPSGERLDSPGLAESFSQHLLQGNELHLALGQPPDGGAVLCCQLTSLPLSPGLESVMLMEQVYRAFKIMAGEPYHK